MSFLFNIFRISIIRLSQYKYKWKEQKRIKDPIGLKLLPMGNKDLSGLQTKIPKDPLAWRRYHTMNDTVRHNTPWEHWI